MKITPNADPCSGNLEVSISRIIIFEGQISSLLYLFSIILLMTPLGQCVFRVGTEFISKISSFGWEIHCVVSLSHPCPSVSQVVTLQDFKWYDFVLKMHRLYKGTHLSVKNVSSMR